MTHYEILQVSPNAGPEVIRAAYRSLMQRYHPDKNPGKADIAERAALIAQAYEVLSDPGKRAAYDGLLGQLASRTGGQDVATASRRPGAKEDSGAPYKVVALVLVALGLLAVWYALSPSQKPQPAQRDLNAVRSLLEGALSPSETKGSPEAELRAIRLSYEGRRLTGREVQERSSRIDEILREHPGVRKADEAETARAIQARTIPAYVSRLAVRVQGSDAEGKPRVLSIPALDVVVGSFDSERFMTQLVNNREYIARKLEERLVGARSDELIRRGTGMDYLKAFILDSFGEITGARRDEEYPSGYIEAPGRYGVVDVVLPEDFSVQ